MVHSPYISGNPALWISEINDTSLRCYLELQQEGTLSNKSYQELERYFSRDLQSIDSALRNREANHDFFYSGMIWKFAQMVLFGLTVKTDQVSKAAQFILSTYRQGDGSFSYFWKPKTGDAVRTGDMIFLLLKCGVPGNTLSSSLAWIRSHQRHDGGWLYCPNYSLIDGLSSALFHSPGKGLRHEIDPEHTSCPYSTLSCLKALRQAGLDDMTRISRGADMLIDHDLFLESSTIPVPLRKGWNQSLKQPGFPVLAQYDILDVLEFCLWGERKDRDPVIRTFNELISRQKKGGRWEYKNFSAGMLLRKPDHRLDGLVTIRMMNLIKLMTTN